MPIKKTISASDFGEQSPMGPDMLRQRGSSFALTLPAKEAGKSMTFIIKGPADKTALAKALDKGEMPDGWSVSVKDSKTGKSYSINAETLFAYRERRQAEGRESATVKKYAATSQVRKKEAPKPAEERKEVAAVREATAAREEYLGRDRVSRGAAVIEGERLGPSVAREEYLGRDRVSPGAVILPGENLDTKRKKRG